MVLDFLILLLYIIIIYSQTSFYYFHISSLQRGFMYHAGEVT